MDGIILRLGGWKREPLLQECCENWCEEPGITQCFPFHGMKMWWCCGFWCVFLEGLFFALSLCSFPAEVLSDSHAVNMYSLSLLLLGLVTLEWILCHSTKCVSLGPAIHFHFVRWYLWLVMLFWWGANCLCNFFFINGNGVLFFSFKKCVVSLDAFALSCNYCLVATLS